MPTIEPNEVESVITTRIARLPATEHAQDIPSATWSETSTIGELDSGNTAAVHLLFAVAVSGVPASPLAAQYADSASVRSRLVVEFFYRLRATKQTDDARSAWNAARQVRRAVMRAPDPRFAVILVDAGRVFDNTQDGVRLIQQQFDVIHDVEV